MTTLGQVLQQAQQDWDVVCADLKSGLVLWQTMCPGSEEEAREIKDAGAFTCIGAGTDFTLTVIAHLRSGAAEVLLSRGTQMTRLSPGQARFVAAQAALEVAKA